jgi:serine/threonine protein kinase/tetratricopeptide (TPR) repeat protein
LSDDIRGGSAWSHLWETFHAVRAVEPSARAALLDQLCAGDLRLKTELEQLLEADQVPASPMDRSPLVAVGSDEEPHVMTVLPGTVLCGRFEIVRLIGQGGMGSVYEALDRSLGGRVALKTLLPRLAGDDRALKRFYREIDLARQVTHPNVCRLFDLFEHRESGHEIVFVTMELLRGETLAERLRRERLSAAEALDVARQIAAALGAAHACGIVHRDLKPANVILTPENGASRAVVTDFGLALRPDATAMSAARVTRSGQLFGTPAYMAPEQLLDGPISPATDLYAFGVLLYEMITGSVPFESDSPFSAAIKRLHGSVPSPREITPGIDEAWERTIVTCLEHDSRDRFQSAAEIIASLSGDRSVSRATLRRGKRVTIWLAACGAAALIAAGAWWITRDSSSANAVALRLDADDWLMIGALENGTREPVFEGSIEYLTERELAQSGVINVASRERIADVLRLMKRGPQTTIDRELAREIALRDGSIHALLIPRIERLGATYVVGLDLIDIRTGNRVATFTSKAKTHDEVMEALSTSARKVRTALGARPRAERDGGPLESVTTPSLRALQLFSEADRIIVFDDNAAAEKLLRAAIEEDPDFASAYMHLAFAMRNQRKAGTEYLAHAGRAASLSGSVSERERLFIIGSDALLREKLAEAISHYQKLVERYPDHFWGTSNLGSILKFRLGRPRDAAPYRIRLAELRPNEFASNFAAAESLYAWSDKPGEARHYFERATELISPIDEEKMTEAVTWSRLHRAHMAWLAGDVKTTLEELELWTARARAMRGLHADMLLEHIALFELALGRLGRAEAIAAMAGEPVSQARISAHLAFWRGDCRKVREGFVVLLKEPKARPPNFDLFRMAQCGMTEPVERLVSPRPDSPDRKILLGIAALHAGRGREATALIDDGLRSYSDVGGRSVSHYLAATEALARLYEEAREPDRSIAVIETASRHRAATFFSGKAEWLAMRRRLARLYRAGGREADAAVIDAEITKLTLPPPVTSPSF